MNEVADVELVCGYLTVDCCTLWKHAFQYEMNCTLIIVAVE